MGGKLLGGLIGSFFGAAPKAQAPAPVSQAPVKDVEDQKTQANKARAALYATEGGAAGEELNPDQVKRRSTIFGN